MLCAVTDTVPCVRVAECKRVVAQQLAVTSYISTVFCWSEHHVIAFNQYKPSAPMV